MMMIKTFDAFTRMSYININKISKFLHKHLEDDCKEDKSAIRKSLLYAAKETSNLGGYAFVIEEKDKIIGAIVVNKTGMSEYQSENLITYLAVHKEYREQKIATKLIKEATKYCNGNLSLNINKNNNAIELFKKNGFVSQKIQMTLHK
ncbi:MULTISPECIES: GNAT family N-acetyltransferase [unclassified Polaribacter]|uniref:GNAT family N-acetyltransferase n=2 Tax=Polaribacter TaxID=52959 RepID=UPI001C4F40E7|nr:MULTISPECIES: GNAT family N-acetyltransferase [unclassified Polaribacter]QXP64189.1 GNAT family N-acetyltransferase [Polaribacter sp. HaHaR_3_91]QXP66694.1 GNAT family N-acetyltransferase [Polaribacter sp. AHE13PA]